MEIEVFVEICREDAVLPSYAKPGDAGMDVCAADNVLIEPGETVIVPTGLKLAIPDGYEIQVRPRSGLSYKTPLRISNSPGTIDSGYRDELGIIMTNTSQMMHENRPSAPFGSPAPHMDGILTISNTGNKPGVYKINKGDRIAQIVLQEVPRMKLTVVDSVSGIGEDRGGGFGSTGVR